MNGGFKDCQRVFLVEVDFQLMLMICVQAQVITRISNADF